MSRQLISVVSVRITKMELLKEPFEQLQNGQEQCYYMQHYIGRNKRHIDTWPFAMDYAVYLYNNMPKRDLKISPLELFTNTKLDHTHLRRTHVWGCPAYVLDPKLQDGHKLPKWSPRSRRGQFLGIFQGAFINNWHDIESSNRLHYTTISCGI